MIEMIAVDSNILLYALEDDQTDKKKITSLNILQNLPFFSAQSLSEVINVCHKRWKYDKPRLVRVGEFL
jgi:predicted nucleic acid-binding protein